MTLHTIIIIIVGRFAIKTIIWLIWRCILIHAHEQLFFKIGISFHKFSCSIDQVRIWASYLFRHKCFIKGIFSIIIFLLCLFLILFTSLCDCLDCFFYICFLNYFLYIYKMLFDCCICLFLYFLKKTFGKLPRPFTIWYLFSKSLLVKLLSQLISETSDMKLH